MSTGTLERRTEAKVWPMDEGGFAVRAADTEAAKAALAEWLMEEPNRERAGLWIPADGDPATDVAEYVGSRLYREGWYRWTPCNPRSCYDGMQHRPGHLSWRDGPAAGVWRGVAVDCS